MSTSARDWLIDGASGASSAQDVLAGTCERLIADGIPVTRADAYVRTLHPQFAGRSFVWERGAGVRVLETQHDDEQATADTMISYTRGARRPQRWRLDAISHRCAIIDELVAIGTTDVVALPLIFSSGDVHVATFSTVQPGGFSELDAGTIEGVMAPLSRMAEILALRRIATNVLTAYVGRDAGARVLAGKIRRGDTELIEAALWFSDMRGFSTVSLDKPPREVIAILNELFDCQLPAIERHGGEILKFIGDGVLAIFTPGTAGLSDCCERALAASQEAVAAVAAHNRTARTALRFGIALHVGEVAYGNIGGLARLDFTCIGRAVNLAARIEGLTARTGQDILASREFVSHCEEHFTAIGDFEVKGFPEPVTAYAPRRG